MKIIFIRHGVTDENVAGRHQPNITPLSPAGRNQAQGIANLLQERGVEKVIASPLNRALETASIIGLELNLIPSIAHEVAELQRPQTLTGYSHYHPRSLWFYLWWWLGSERDQGESYKSLRQRIFKAQHELAHLPPTSTIAVVSHTVFINLFLAHMCRQQELGPIDAAVTFLKLARMRNIALIEVEYNPAAGACSWTLIE